MPATLTRSILTEAQRLAVRTELLPLCEHPAPMTRDALLDHVRECLDITPGRWKATARARWSESIDDALVKIQQAPTSSPDEDEDDEDAPLDWDGEAVKPKPKKAKALLPRSRATSVAKVIPIRPKQESKAKVKPGEEWADGFARLPYPVIDKLLHAMPPGVLRVYLALLRFESYTDGTMFPGQERLGTLAGMSDRQIRVYVSALHDVGLVTYKRRPNLPSLYRHVPLTQENWREILRRLEAWTPSRKMTAADRARLSDRW